MRTKSFSMLCGAAMLALICTATAQADHVCRQHYLNEYEIACRNLNGELRERCAELRCAFREKHDYILCEIRRVSSTLCGPERDVALSELYCKLRETKRCYHRDVRNLHAEIAQRRSCLARELDIALRKCTTTFCTDDACGGGLVITPYDGCTCPECPPSSEPAIPPPPIDRGYQLERTTPNHTPEYAPSPGSNYRDSRYEGTRYRDRYPSRAQRSTYPADRRDFDWESLVVALARRLGR